MQLFCIGLNHTTAPIQVREKCVFDEYQVRAALAHKGCGDWNAASELLILSTCNRTEIFAVAQQDVFYDLECLLAEARGESVETFRPYLYHLKRIEVVRHLFEVASGLDSLVIGEPQILGQITRALELARGAGTAGPLLNRLFLAAIHSGKRARTETAICRNAASVSSLAASLAEEFVPDLSEARVAILGAGEMAEIAIEALRRRGVSQIIVVNRTLKRAQELATRWKAQTNIFENLADVLANVDIVIASTGAPHIIVHKEMVKEAMHLRPQQPLILIDIALPRDIDPEAADLAGVYLYDIDHLNTRIDSCITEREAEIPNVKEIVEQELNIFREYLRSLQVLPLIARLRQQAEQIRQTELEKTLRHLPELTAEEQKHVDALSRALVKKLLAAPTHCLRAESTLEYADIVRQLFGLDGLDPIK